MFLPLRLRCSLDSETFLFFIGSGYDLWRGENSRELSQNPISKMIPFYVLYPELGTGERLLPQSKLTPKCNHIEALISLSRCCNVKILQLHVLYCIEERKVKLREKITWSGELSSQLRSFPQYASKREKR